MSVFQPPGRPFQDGHVRHARAAQIERLHPLERGEGTDVRYVRVAAEVQRQQARERGELADVAKAAVGEDELREAVIWPRPAMSRPGLSERSSCVRPVRRSMPSRLCTFWPEASTAVAAGVVEAVAQGHLQQLLGDEYLAVRQGLAQGVHAGEREVGVFLDVQPAQGGKAVQGAERAVADARSAQAELLQRREAGEGVHPAEGVFGEVEIFERSEAGEGGDGADAVGGDVQPLKALSPISGERLATLLPETLSSRSAESPTRGERSLISLPERSSDSSCSQTASWEMSSMPLPERSSSVTSEVKVTPPSVISTSSTVGSSEMTAQPGRAFCSSSSCSSVISMPEMSSVVRLVSACSGV